MLRKQSMNAIIILFTGIPSFESISIVHLKKQTSRESGLTLRSWMMQVTSTFQATFGSRFSTLATLADEDIWFGLHGNERNWHNSWAFCRQCRKKKHWVAPKILNLSGHRRSPVKKDRRTWRSQRKRKDQGRNEEEKTDIDTRSLQGSRSMPKVKTKSGVFTVTCLKNKKAGR